MNASIRPSGESAGEVAESAKAEQNIENDGRHGRDQIENKNAGHAAEIRKGNERGLSREGERVLGAREPLREFEPSALRGIDRRGIRDGESCQEATGHSRADALGFPGVDEFP